MVGIVVTGGFGALGSALVGLLAEAGHAVIAIDRAPAPPDSRARLCLGGVDLTDPDAARAAFAEAATATGGLAGLAAIAGGFLFQPMTGMGTGAEAWDRMYAINLKSCVLSCSAALPHLADGAAIVTVGAAAAGQPGAGMAPYAAAKAGILALTQSLADELRPRRIRVNAVLPTILDTPQNATDMPDADRTGWVKPGSAARAIAFLLGPDSAAITGAGIALSTGF